MNATHLELLASTRSGFYTSREQANFFRADKGLTQPQMEGKGFASVRRLRDVLNKGVELADARAIGRAYFEEADPPVTEAWDRRIATLKDLSDLAVEKHSSAIACLTSMSETDYAQSELRITITTARLKLRHPIERHELMHLVGKTYYTAQFCMTMAELVVIGEASQRAWFRTAKVLFGLVIRLLKQARANSATATLMFKAQANRMAVMWNLTSPASREGHRMRRLVAATGFFDGLQTYAKTPKASDQYVINAVGVASRLNFETKFKSLRLLLKSTPYGTLRTFTKLVQELRKCSFDQGSDYDRFIEWWKNERKGQKEKKS